MEKEQSGQNKKTELGQLAQERFELIQGYYGKTKQSGENKNEPDLKQIAQEGFEFIRGYYGKMKQSGENKNERDLKQIAQEGFKFIRGYYGKMKQSGENKNERDLKQIGQEGFALIDKFYGAPPYKSQSTKPMLNRTSKPKQWGYHYDPYAYVPFRSSQEAAMSHDSSGKVKDAKAKHNGDGNSNSNSNSSTILPSNDNVLSCIDIPITMDKIPTTTKERMMNKILAAKGRIGSEFKGSDYKSLFKFACDQLLSGNAYAPLSSEWAEVLQELKSLEVELYPHNNLNLHHHHASFSSQQSLQDSSKQVPMGDGHKLTPLLISYSKVVNIEENLKGIINNQNGVILGHGNGSIFFYFYNCQIMLMM